MESDIKERRSHPSKDSNSVTDPSSDVQSNVAPPHTSTPEPIGNALHSFLRGLGMSDRWVKWWIRGVFGMVMIIGFIFIILMGKIALSIMILCIEIKCFDEIITIGHRKYKEYNLPWYRVINWLFYATANYFFYGENLSSYFPDLIASSNTLIFLFRYHRMISFLLYVTGFVFFVLTLKKDYYRVQFSLFGWTHVSLLIFGTQAFLAIQNVFEGLYWFVLPVSMVICNDVMAYFFGFFFGKTRLIKLSPKKTWEGFLGALASTVVFAFIMSWILAHVNILVCSENSKGECEADPVFQYTPYPITLLGFSFNIWLLPCMLHSLVLAVFASLIAPFGGFFASGFKRAFQVKDFSDIIPGHGGIMDRFDCQLLMASFSNVYLNTFCKGPTSFKVWHTVLLLTPDQQIELYDKLKESLQRRDLI